MTVYKYQGQPSEHYEGVPARDLTEEEYDALTEQQQFNVTEGTLYRAVGQPRGTTRASRAEQEPEPEPEPADEPADTADEQAPVEPGGEG